MRHMFFPTPDFDWENKAFILNKKKKTSQVQSSMARFWAYTLQKNLFLKHIHSTESSLKL